MDNPILGQQIKRLREAASLTQAELGKRVGWTYTTISKIETGRRPVTLSELTTLLRAISEASRPKWKDEEYQRHLDELQALIAGPQPQVFEVVTGKDIFPSAIKYLREQPHRKRVYIYAPTGVWRKERDTKKAEWFQAIADSLKEYERQEEEGSPPQDASTTPTTLEEFIGVYGLPAKGPSAAEQLDRVEDLLMPFSGRKYATLYRLGVDASTIPGTGAIVIDNSIFIGFAAQKIDKVNYVLAFLNQEQVADQVAKWFTKHVVGVVGHVKHHTIQDTAYYMDVPAGMDDIRIGFYKIPPRHTKSKPTKRSRAKSTTRRR